MRPLISILFIALLFFNLFGFYLAFVVKQDAIRIEMTASIKEECHANREVISLSSRDFKNIVWLKKNREFRYNGKLYDVEHVEISAEGVKLFVEYDADETKLVDDFLSFIGKQTENEKSNSPLKLAIEHVLKEFTVEQNVVVFHPVFRCVSFFETGSHFSSFISEQQSPPPDILFS